MFGPLHLHKSARLPETNRATPVSPTRREGERRAPPACLSKLLVWNRSIDLNLIFNLYDRLRTGKMTVPGFQRVLSTTKAPVLGEDLDVLQRHYAVNRELNYRLFLRDLYECACRGRSGRGGAAAAHGAGAGTGAAVRLTQAIVRTQ